MVIRRRCVNFRKVHIIGFSNMTMTWRRGVVASWRRGVVASWRRILYGSPDHLSFRPTHMRTMIELRGSAFSRLYIIKVMCVWKSALYPTSLKIRHAYRHSRAPTSSTSRKPKIIDASRSSTQAQYQGVSASNSSWRSHLMHMAAAAHARLLTRTQAMMTQEVSHEVSLDVLSWEASQISFANSTRCFLGKLQ
jgi:hypothetical protein